MSGRQDRRLNTEGQLVSGRRVASNDIGLQEKNNPVTTGQPDAALDATVTITTADALRSPLFDVLVGTSGLEIKYPPSLNKACQCRSG